MIAPITPLLAEEVASASGMDTATPSVLQSGWPVPVSAFLWELQSWLRLAQVC